MAFQNFLVYASLFVSFGFLITYAFSARWYATYIGKSMFGLLASLALAFGWIAANHVWIFSVDTRITMGTVIYATILTCLSFLWFGLVVLQWRVYRKKHHKS
jgi:hypothetical protein